MKVISLQDGFIQLDTSFISEPDACDLYQLFVESTPWQQDCIKMYGRQIDIPRLQAWYGNPDCSYRYSGLQLQPLPWTEPLTALKQQIEKACDHRFNSVLLNYYRDGQDSNGWHSDDERELGNQPVIASLSLGEVRRFRLRHKNDKALSPLSIDLNSGSLLLMAGDAQHCWQHCITKTKKSVSGRINLTFRNIITTQSS